MSVIIEENPYIESNYDDSLSKYQQITDPLERSNLIHELFKNKQKYFRLKPSEINTWLDCLHVINDPSLEYDFYKCISSDNSDAMTLNGALEYYKKLLDENFLEEDQYQDAFAGAIKKCGSDFLNGNKIWNKLLDFFKDKYVNSEADEDLQKLIKLHLKRLSFPHQQLDESFSEFSSLISEFDNENYDTQMITANKIYSLTKLKLPYFEKYEFQIKKTPEDPQLWIDYMENVYKHSQDGNTVLSIFSRATALDISWSNEWEKVWMSLVYLLYSDDNVDEEILAEILQKYVKTFPKSSHAYAETIRNCLMITDGMDVFNEVKLRIDKTDLMNHWSYQEWKLVALAIIQCKYQVITQYDWIDELEGFLVMLTEYADLAMKSNDVFHSIEKLAIQIFTKLGDTQSALSILESMFDVFKDQLDVWLFGIDYYINNNVESSVVRELFERALSYSELFDLPEKITEEWLLYEQINGNVHDYTKAVLACNNAMKKVTAKREQASKVQPKEVTNNKKRKHEEVDKEPETKSREKLTVKVENLPPAITEKQLKDFFKDCGELGDISILDDLHIAIFDFQSEQQVFSGLTKNYKKIDNHEILVNRLQNALLFVNNYPSTYSQSELKDLFAKTGPVANIRFPNQTSKRMKRFCYVQMTSSQDAEKLINEFNGKKYHDENLGSEFSWEVKLSSPHDKHERSTPISERKVRVVNIPFKVTKKAFEDKFASCGDLEHVVFPKATINDNGVMENNGGLAIVTYKSLEGLENALKLNDSKWNGRKLVVSKQQQQKNHPHYTPTDFDGVKSIGLHNLDPSLNFHQVKKYFEDNFGKTSKILLFPEDKQGLVEFVAATDAGKVGLNNNLGDLGDGQAKVVDKDEIMSVTSKSKVSKQPSTPALVPTSIRRRKLK
ncbi:hypothetical protein SBY92_004192 [Candida maltosa Xu316]|uniref:RRM domain-containing protein n=1 Tax=Candida maltosa (strain Xu316) TaxID=1245528 RepID=M3K164_CANMX|nr:hypothetical protein G210_0305 [Candida maltosa Xu316]